MAYHLGFKMFIYLLFAIMSMVRLACYRGWTILRGTQGCVPPCPPHPPPVVINKSSLYTCHNWNNTFSKLPFKDHLCKKSIKVEIV